LLDIVVFIKTVMVCINSLVNVKQRQTQRECDPILKCE